MTSKNLDLATMFKAASKALKQNQDTLNQADQYNHNHGDNMVDVFGTITKAMQAKKDAPAADQLEYAAQLLKQNPSSGSAVAYSEGLDRAAQQFQGKSLNPGNAMDLISALMGVGSSQQPAANPTSDLLGSLLGGGSTAQQSSSPAGDLLGSLLGGGSAQAEQSNPAGDLLGSLLGGSSAPAQGGSGSSDLIGSLLGGLTGSAPAPQQAGGGMNAGSLINIGMQLFQAYQAGSGKPASQSGGGLVGGLMDTLLSNSSMSSSSHRTESGKVVMDALLKIASQYLSRRN